jgi:type II secretory pathway component PulM
MTLRESWLGHWERLARRERGLLITAATVVAGVGGYALLYEPLARDLAATEAALARARAETRVARGLADEVAGLARATPPTPTGDVRSAVERVAAQQGVKGALTALEVQDGVARLTFADIGVDAFAGFVEAVGREERLHATDALLAARVTPGRVRAEATLVRSPKP